MGPSLMVTWLVVNLVASEPSRAAAAPASLVPNWPASVDGFGLTVEDAKKEALRHMVRIMQDVLRGQEPPLVAWQPTAEYVRRHIIAGEGHSGKDEELGNAVTSKRWIYPVKPLDLAALRALDQEAQRAQRRAQRVTAATQVFAVLASILGILAWRGRMMPQRRAR